MRFVNIRQLRQGASKVWKELEGGGELVLTSNGKPIAILMGVNEDNLDTYLTALRRSKAVVALNQIQTEAATKGLDKLTEEEIEKEIGLARKERYKDSP
ncbi:MAG: type II toxin-antitoxin system Phd/YefM family antitoxin [Deltaproteobacteria bacterium]|nr:type II toxin-antitoxin system Phd/YefM family antitoxin [Deltaproteobacteria bacterium]